MGASAGSCHAPSPGRRGSRPHDPRTQKFVKLPLPYGPKGIRIALMALVQAVGFCIPNVKAQSGCYLSSVLSPAPLLGNHGEVVRLADGSLWEVIGGYLYL